MFKKFGLVLAVSLIFVLSVVSLGGADVKYILPFNLIEPGSTSGGTIKTTTPTLKWEKNGASGGGNHLETYTIQVSYFNDFSSFVIDYTQNASFDASYAVPANKLNPDTTYYWRVIAKDHFNNVKTCNDNFSFYIADSNYRFTLINPASEIWLNTTTPTLQWENSIISYYPPVTYKVYIDEYSDGYGHKVSESPICTSPDIVGVDNNTWTVPGGQLSDWDANGHMWYYWNVRAQDTFIHTMWGNGDEILNNRFRVDSKVPTSTLSRTSASPTHSFSANFTVVAADTGGSTIKDIDVWTRYKAAGGSTWTSPQKVLTITDGAIIGQTNVSYNFTIGDIKDSISGASFGTYELYTRVHDYAGNYEAAPGTADYCSVEVVENADPNAFSLVSPANNSNDISLTPTLDWGDATDSDGTIATYTIVVSKNIDLSSPVINDTKNASLGSSYTVPSGKLEKNKVYYWRVKATDEDGGYTWSNPSPNFQFKTAGNQPPDAFNLLTPGDNTWIKTTTPTLTWETATDTKSVSNYTLWVSDGSAGAETDKNNFSNKTIDVTQAGTSYDVPGSTLVDYDTNGNRPYYWIVKATDDEGASTPANNIFTFKVDSKKPTSSVNSFTGIQHPPIITVEITNDDTGGSGIDFVELWYRHRSNQGGTWSGWNKHGDYKFKKTNKGKANISVLFDTPSAGGCGQYEFYSKAKDVAGNWEDVSGSADAGVTVNEYESAVELISPTNDVWLTTKTPTLVWRDVNVRTTFNFREKYRILISDGSAGAETDPFNFQNKTVNKELPAELGPNYTVKTEDNLKDYSDNGNRPYYWAALAIDNNDLELPGTLGGNKLNLLSKANPYVFSFKIDSQAPTSGAGPAPTTSNTLTFEVPFTANDTGGSGVKEVKFFYSQDSSGWTSFGKFSASPISFTAPTDGNYSFRTIATDNAGNVEFKVGAGEGATLVDTMPPFSQIGSLPSETTSTSFNINYTAGDGGLSGVKKAKVLNFGSGVKEVQLWYRYRKKPAYSYGSWILYGTFTSSPMFFNTALASGLGQYQLYTIAIDNAGNVESAPVTADEEIYVTTSPTPAPIPPTPPVPPVGLDLKVRIGYNIANANANGDVGEGIVIPINPSHGQLVFLGTTTGIKVEVQNEEAVVLDSQNIGADGLFTIIVPIPSVLPREARVNYYEGSNRFNIVAYNSANEKLTLVGTVLLDSTPPVLSDLKANGEKLLTGDFISSSTVFAVKVVDVEGSGIDPATFKFLLKDPNGTTIFESAAGGYSSYDAANAVFEFKPDDNLIAGNYSLEIEIGDSVTPVNLGSLKMDNLLVSSLVNISGSVLPYPNPYNPGAGNLIIAYVLSADADIVGNIYSAAGQRVFKGQYASGTTGGKAGYNEITWNGRDGFGEIIANGLYLIHLVEKGSGKIIGRTKLAVVRR